jgi:5-methyltetrahydropteroyltriglutamate--homocysteine methyltransferase
MKRILTTHVGSLPALESVEAVVRKQREIGLDLINEGEYTKGGDWLSYVEERFGGFEPRPAPPGETPLIAQGRDREAFADFYRYATERGTLFYTPGEQIKRVRPVWYCMDPVTYEGRDALNREIEVLKQFVAPQDAFLTSTAPGSLEVYRRNEHYRSEEEFVYAIAEAMRIEYETIVAAGVTLQVDDLAARLVGPHRPANRPGGVSQVLPGQDRSAESRVAQRARGQGALPPVLGQLARTACP